LGLLGGLFKGDSGDFGGRGGEGALSTIGRGSSGVFEANPGTPAPSAPDSPSLRRGVMVPGIVGSAYVCMGDVGKAPVKTGME
jgi:hypothetical protein